MMKQLDPTRDGEDEALAVPRLLHRIWLGSPIPRDAETYWYGWGKLHPAWNLQTWTETNRPTLRNEQIYRNAEQLTAGNPWQLRSDILRYELLYLHGGVYIDCDMEPRLPIDELVVGIDCFAAWEKQEVWVNNAVMGARPQHPFLSALIEQLPASAEANRRRRPNHATGPRFLTRMYRDHPDAIHIFDQHLFYPYSWSELERGNDRFPDAYAVHHWANARRMKQGHA